MMHESLETSVQPSGQHAVGDNKFVKRLKVCSMFCLFVASCGIGFYVVGPIAKHAMTDSEAVQQAEGVGKFVQPGHFIPSRPAKQLAMKNSRSGLVVQQAVADPSVEWKPRRRGWRQPEEYKSMQVASKGSRPDVVAPRPDVVVPQALVDTLRTSASNVEGSDVSKRLNLMRQYFPTSIEMGDFVNGLAKKLGAKDININGDNSIPISTLCRDECVRPLQEKIESAFGQSFNAHGLGGLPNMGQTGMKAAMSHSPNLDGKERYIFFAMPHISIDENANIGSMSRPNRASSHACGALIGCLGVVQGAPDLKALAVSKPEVAPTDPELSVLIKKLASRMDAQNIDAKSQDLVSITKEAQKLVEEDLLKLIAATVDTQKADYAVVTGVQIHSSVDWKTSSDSPATMEFVAPSKTYAVVGGKKIELSFGGAGDSNEISI